MSNTSNGLERLIISIMEIMAGLFIFIVGIALFVALFIYLKDRFQTTSTVRRNFPLIGRFRYLFEELGEFFRQYFFAMDREEMPFNRAQRSWAYRAAKGIDRTVAFGSTKSLRPEGTILFINAAFPTLEKDAVTPPPLTIGPYCKKPYEALSLFNISGMSYGALSKPAVLALSQGAKSARCWMNTGEGGLSPAHLEGGADIIFQIGTAKYGVRDKNGNLSNEKLRAVAAHPQVKMFELKLSQGAKPGKGGILPAVKVTAEIAAIRGIPAGEASISPNRHPEISTVYELLDMINHIREVTCKPVGFKAVISSLDWLETLFDEVLNRGIESAPDFITIDGADGGTGAAPMPLMDDVGLPLAESLPMLVDLLERYHLKTRTKVIASGKLITPDKVAWALTMGADFIVSARGFMFALGCIQAMQCNKNSCPTGITTHNPELQQGLVPSQKSVRVANYQSKIMYGVGLIAHSCGVSSPRKLDRKHARMVVGPGKSIPLNELYPQAKGH
ncbi:MAG: FMN-binding glutamate synthase family protein [Gammaproteobacteria bacterium]|nr:MAG: FMN-binding glutamate synthase family protein [Gammaproteobacteria bacterium]